MALGARMMRLEDRPLLTGSATFTDDIRDVDALEAAFYRSPIAHGRILAIDTSEAIATDGVTDVLTAADLDLPPLLPPNTNPAVTPPAQPPLASGKVRFVGEPIAVVVAADRYLAEDAAETILADLEQLEPVTDPWRAISTAAPEIHLGQPNLVVDVARDEGDVDGAFAAAAVTVERTFNTPRHSAMPIETRAVLAVPDGDGVKLWSSTQAPHKVRQLVAETLGIEPALVRVIAPDVGGGFGVKAHVYPEEIVLAALALRLGQAVKWVEDRAEHMAAATQARKQELRVRAAMSADGDLLALDVDMLCDQGAYGAYPHGVSLEAMTTSGMLPGPYRLENFRARIRTAVTTTSPEGAYRGVGFVIAAFTHERIIEALAREAGLDPVDVRRRNLIAADELPRVSVTGQPYDNGDYRQALELALDRIGFGEIAERKASAAAEGKLLGFGLACYVEPTGMNSTVFAGRGMSGIEGFDSAHVELLPDGGARLWSTTPSIGQGSTTTLAQLAAESLGIDAARIRVEHSDTGAAELEGTGTFASRSAASTGGAVRKACGSLRERLIEDAAELLECSTEDLEVHADGMIGVAGSPARDLAVGEVVARDPDRYRLSSTFDPPQSVYPYATHACLVSVEPETGAVTIERYVIAEDCGRMINPLIVEGQVHGATAQGIGGVLFEGHHYDEDGQLRTASLMDYLVPTATEVPHLELHHLELPSPINESGVKGVGEGGTIGAAPAIANAIGDALGTEVNHFPVTPEEIHAAAREQRVIG